LTTETTCLIIIAATNPKIVTRYEVKKFLALAICAVAVGCGDTATTTTNNNTNNTTNSGTDRAVTIAALTGSATDGEAVYGQLCAVCHGADGAGTAAGNSLIDSTKTKDEAIDSILNGVSGTTMASFAARTDQELADLTAYTLAFQP